MTTALWVVASYLLGATPTAYLAGRLARGIDLRQHGSKNLGATNVYRVLGWRWAIPVALVDIAKGAIPVALFGRWAAGGPWLAVGLGVAAVLGHVFSPYMRFKGGKGVATALGVLLALSWPVGVLAMATWLAVAALARISSLAALVALAASPVYAWFLADPQRAQLAAFLAIVVWLRHHENIRRILKGDEPRIGAKKQGG